MRFTSTTADPFNRGEELGQFGGEQIRSNVRRYEELFDAVGVGSADRREYGADAIARITEWAPALAAELRGLSNGSGVPLWQLGMLNARTEILAIVGETGEGECSTVVYLPARSAPRTVQTWDWHDTSNPNTLVTRHITGRGRSVTYFTEFGLVGKIGLNDAGVGVHFNILNHASDGDGIGVPVHVVARRVLDEATTLDQALDIIQSASVSASTVLTVVTFDGSESSASSIELSPMGAAVVKPTGNLLVHTNHFLDKDLARGEMSLAKSSSYPRFAQLRARRADLEATSGIERARGMLVHDVDGAAVCCHPDPAMPFYHRWQTLLTIALDLEGARLQFHEGGPCTVTEESWQTF
ncbi:C45 family peptidase [Diaminobutyricibacter sp. McL0608]|uniref:C45 family peptidase n=1 Tax=Leifsonia sp. McL0608 TaxID=3143537 RepID=UPI0031F311F6